jgi:hypothetical protein
LKHHTEAKDKQARLQAQTTASSGRGDQALSADRGGETGVKPSELKGCSDSRGSTETTTWPLKSTKHQDVLDTIDGKLLPNVQNDPISAAYLMEIRPTVEAHLKQAREIQAKLNQAASR